MLRSTKELLGYRLDAAEGLIGTVSDFLFDEAQWTIRWMVTDTGNWLPGRKVLISPIMLGEPDWNARVFPVRLTKDEVENSPGLGYDEPVSREYETRFFDQYGWPYYWNNAGVWGAAPAPMDLFTRQEKAERTSDSPEAGSDVLRSVQEVMGYHIQAVDDEVGHVEDFIMDDKSWTVRYMVVDTRNWLPGRKALVATEWVDAVYWKDTRVTVGLTRDAIKGSPEYKPSTPINREYETRLYDYYGRPVYW